MQPFQLNAKMILAVCELHHPTTHGLTEASSANISSHFLLLEEVSSADWPGEDSSLPPPPHAPHPYVRCYGELARHPRCSGLQVVREHVLEGGESVAVIHTGAIRRLQRKWRTRVGRGS